MWKHQDGNLCKEEFCYTKKKTESWVAIFDGFVCSCVPTYLYGIGGLLYVVLLFLLCPFHFSLCSGLPDFPWSKYTKTGKIYQMNTNYTKRQ
jgi:hypothetical protein